MSIDNTEVMDSFDDDFSDDFDYDDSGSTETVNNRDHSVSEVDAVCDILLGGDGSGHKSKANDSGMRSRDVDQHGRVDYSAGLQPEEPAYARNQSAPDMQSAQARAAHYERESLKLQTQWADLEAMKQDLTPEQYEYQRNFLQGQAAGAVIQHQQAQLEQMQNERWLAGEEAKVREKHADVFNDPQKREVYNKKMLDYLGGIGYSQEELEGIGAREYNAVLDHIKVTEERDQLKLQVAKLKQERRARNRSLKQGRADIERGAGRNKSGGRDVYDEVARILGGQK